MNGDVFVDTNVLVYNRDAGERTKQPTAASWLEHLWESGRGRLSVQVLQEYYAVVTRKLTPGLPADEAREEIRDYSSWRPLVMTADLLDYAFAVESRHHLAWWDALIVAAAQTLGCSTLLTEDLQDGLDLDGLLVTDPFSHPPPA